jgi:hypothetical protein
MAELDIFMQKYIDLVSTRCNCDKNVLTTLYQELLYKKSTTCSYKFERGTKRGTNCGDEIFKNGFCKKHAKQLATKEKIQGKKQSSIKSEVETVIEPKKTDIELKTDIEPQKTDIELKKTDIELKTDIEPKKTDIEPKKTDVEPKKNEIIIELAPVIVHFDSKLNENMMHVNKSPIEITKEYEKIMSKTPQVQAQQQKIIKRRILPPSLRPALKIGDKVSYNDGKKMCNGIIKKIIKDMAELENAFTGPMRYMYLIK